MRIMEVITWRSRSSSRTGLSSPDMVTSVSNWVVRRIRRLSHRIMLRFSVSWRKRIVYWMLCFSECCAQSMSFLNVPPTDVFRWVTSDYCYSSVFFLVPGLPKRLIYVLSFVRIGRFVWYTFSYVMFPIKSIVWYSWYFECPCWFEYSYISSYPTTVFFP